MPTRLFTKSEYAKFCLQLELFGFSDPVEPHERDVALHGLRDAGRQREFERIRHLVRVPRQEAFRARLDALMSLHMEAVRAIESGSTQLRDCAETALGYKKLPSAENLFALAEGAAASVDVSDEVSAPISAYASAVRSFVFDEVPALGRLPWGPDWAIFVTRSNGFPQRWSYREQSFIGLMRSGSGLREFTFDAAADLGIPPVAVEWDFSREVVRKRLMRAIEDEMRGEPGWTVHGAARKQAKERVEDRLDEEFPPDKRPYSLDDYGQVRRDLRVWVRHHVDGISTEKISIEAQQLVGESKFSVRDGGTRTQIPTSQRGVQLMLGRANDLLTTERTDLNVWQ